MPATTEQIHAALFARVANATWVNGDNPATTFVTTSRRVKLFSDVDPNSQPALFQAEHDAVFEQKTNLPYKRTFEVQWIIYNAVNDGNASPTSDLNNILDACVAAMSPTPGEFGWPQRNTLGGLVYHCFINGKILKDPGDIDNQGMMIIPITILAP